MTDKRIEQLIEILGAPDETIQARDGMTLKWNSQPGTINWVTCHIVRQEIQVVSLWCSIHDYCHPFANKDDALVVASKIAVLRSL